MGVPMVKKCCCCATLQTGTLIIAYIYTVWSLLELAGYILLVTLAPLGRDGVVSSHKYVFYVTAASVNGVTLFCSILLIVAAYKKLPFLTLPWTIVTGILTAIFFVLCLTGMSLILQDSGKLLEIEIIIIVVHLARACKNWVVLGEQTEINRMLKGISVYSIIVVHSRHKQIMNEEDESRFQRSARMYQPVQTRDLVI